MKVSVLRERDDGETRVAATPESIAKLIGLGAAVSVETGAGEASRIPDRLYRDAGAEIAPSAAAALKGADVVLAVRRPAASALAGVNSGAVVLAMMDPHGNEAALEDLARAGVSAFAMELMPRITRAQVMDVLSSQANLAGYQAVIEAAAAFDRALPMMMTAAGTVRAAKVFVMGAGVAGLQAIATARRLGAVVSATDVRAAAGEQVESLGAKFIMTDALKDASGGGGYARELTADEQAAQAELVAGHIARQDIVITTALIPGRPAPRLVTRAMVESMAPGSVIVDLAAERGGNVELTEPGRTIVYKDVTVIGALNLAGRVAATASQLYAKNLLSFLETMIDKEKKAIAVDMDDELVKATLLTSGGAVVHPDFAGRADAGAPAAAGKPAASRKAAAPKTAKPAGAKAEAPVKTGPVSKTAAAKKPASKAADKAVAETPVKTGAAKTGATRTGAAKSRAAKTDAAGKTGEPAAAKPAAAKPAAAKKPVAKAPAKKPAAQKDGGQ